MLRDIQLIRGLLTGRGVSLSITSPQPKEAYDATLSHTAIISDNGQAFKGYGYPSKPKYIIQGGEEFLILLPQTDLDGAYRVAEKIRRAMENATHPVAGACTASFGVAERMKGEAYSDLFRRADEALYRAKENGRNRLVTHDAMSNLLRIKWNSGWNSGNVDIDRQHRELVDMANDVLAVVITTSENREIESKLDSFADHLEKHFNYEESLLADIGYEGAQAHSMLHKKLLDKMSEIKRSLNAAESAEGGSLIVSYIINDIVVGHMLMDDVEFFSYMPKQKA